MASADAGAAVQLGHRPGLDGLRGLAVAGVLVAHSEIAGLFPMAGGVGVTVFFVLSGFLITKLLLEEQDRGGISLRRFYERRARRLLPALPLVLTVCALVNVWLGEAVWVNVAAAVGYGSNWMQLAGEDGGAFRHLWSLAVEEHFYLVWPLVVAAFRRHLLAVCVGGAVVVAGVRMLAPWDADVLYRATPLRLDAMLAGCALAVLMHHRRLPQFRRTGVAWPVLAAAALNISLGEWMRWVTPAVVVAAVVLIVVELERPTLTHPALRRLGRISYGVYLLHYPVSLIARRELDGWSSFTVTVAVTIAMAELSYRVIEARWLGLRLRDDTDEAGHEGAGPPSAAADASSACRHESANAVGV